MLALLAALLLTPAAHAAPVELRYDPAATAVALAGPDAIVMSSTRTGGTKIVAVPRTGGPARTLLELEDTGYISLPQVLAASAQRVAAVVVTKGREGEWTIFSGPPSGPLTPLERIPNPDGVGWQPSVLDVDGDRLLVVEVGGNWDEVRARVHTPATGFRDVAWAGPAGAPLAIAGPYAAAFRHRSQTVELVDLASGATSATLKGDWIDSLRLDVTADGRIVAPTEEGLLTTTPGAPQRIVPGSRGLLAPRFAGTSIAGLDRGGPLAVVAADGARTTFGPASWVPTAMDADAQGEVWLYNGCIRSSDGVAAGEVCPAGEVGLRTVNAARLVGRSVKVPVRCVNARGAACRGTVLARNWGGKVVGRGRFAVPLGTERRVALRLTAGAVARLRRGGAVRLDARVTGGTLGNGRYRSAELRLKQS